MSTKGVRVVAAAMEALMVRGSASQLRQPCALMTLAMGRIWRLQRAAIRECWPSRHSELSSLDNTLAMPGDTMTTTCTYFEAATFGPSTMQELCHLSSVAWPAGSVNYRSGALLHGANTCFN